uniref:Trehalase n=1 Tax=Hirondellea gigas TaxID=1518452 RepID=A0A2P2HXY8_9CRUS
MKIFTSWISVIIRKSSTWGYLFQRHISSCVYPRVYWTKVDCIGLQNNHFKINNLDSKLSFVKVVGHRICPFTTMTGSSDILSIDKDSKHNSKTDMRSTQTNLRYCIPGTGTYRNNHNASLVLTDGLEGILGKTAPTHDDASDLGRGADLRKRSAVMTSGQTVGGRRHWTSRSFAVDINMTSTIKSTVLGLVLVMCFSNVGLAAAAQTVAATNTTTTLPPPCDSNIYCYGELLKTVQLARLHEDSKYFVDMTLKFSPARVQENFGKLMEDTSDDPTRKQVAQFVDDNFDEPGTEFEPWTPEDWQENPAFLSNISDPIYRAWAEDLHEIWKDLGRKISIAVKEEPDRFSQLYVDNPVVVPGGRFRECYYWDSYWTIDGLLLSGMTTTVKGMLENFIKMVEEYGMVPNGGRVYYTRRSQPPYMIPMIKLYVDHTQDMQFISDNIGHMERELNFWIKNRTTEVTYKGKTYEVAQYNVQVDEPRPESYREDYKVAQSVPENDRTQLYVEYKSGAESGWDYSSRWFVDEANANQGSLKDLAVTSIAPVDLNSLLCYNAKIISDYYWELGDSKKAKRYEAVHEDKKKTLTELFWDERDGVWYDINITNMRKRRFFYLSNIHPLWSGSYNKSNGEEVMAKVINYLKKQKVLDYIGGVPTSTQNTGQQWDFPNAWAPLQHLVVMALRENRDLHEEADAISLQLAEKWIQSNWQGYEDVKAMFEKYNVEIIGAPGGGGEYDVQVGFGWTNGVALRFLNDFGDRLKSPEQEQERAAEATTTGGSLSLHASKLSSANYLIPVVAAAANFLAR